MPAAAAQNPLLATSNTLGFPVLSLVVFLPAAGAILVALQDPRRRSLHGALGLLVAGITLVLAGILMSAYDPDWLVYPASPAFQFADPPAGPAVWLPGGITYQVGVDGVSVALVFLTTLLTFVALLFSWATVRERSREFVALVLVLETGLIGVFASLDLFLFYVFWEAALIQMYLLIAVWGGKDRVYATTKFIVYTLAGSALMLIGIVSLVAQSGSPTFHLFDVLQQPGLAGRSQLFLFAAFALAFAVKVPLVPLHTWLPDAHVEAPTAGSVMLAGVLLKLGGYGFVRFAMPLFPDASRQAVPVMLSLAVLGVWYGAWVAFAQEDVKSLVAYSSIGHLGLAVAGFFAMNVQGLTGGVVLMLSHGLSTGALFLLVGMLYARTGTRLLAAFSGLRTTMPRLATVFLIVMLASIGLPGTSGFVGEWLSLLGLFRSHMLLGALAAFGVVLSAAYMLRLYQRVFFGPPSETSAAQRDLTGMEMLAVAPLVLIILWIGVYPGPLLSAVCRACQAWLLIIDPATPLGFGQ